MPPKGTRGRKGKRKAVLRDPIPEPEPIVEEPQTPEDSQNGRAKKKKTVTSFSEAEKEEIIEFLIQNEILYSKRLAGFKDVVRKDALWAVQAAKMNTTAEQLKTWYASMRTVMGRLKKRMKKSGSGGDTITDMNSTEKWVWDKFSFLVPHIETVDSRNVASFLAATQSASGIEVAYAVDDESSRDSQIPASTPTSGSVSSRRNSDERSSSTEMKDLLVEFMSRSTVKYVSSFFGRYVEDTLSNLPGEIRREAEANIMQELHRAQRAAEMYQRQPPPCPGQPVPPHIQSQGSSFQQWQPQPTHWPTRPIGSQPSVWGSQDRNYVQRQFPSLSMTCQLPSMNKPCPGPSGIRPTAIASTTSASLSSSEDCSFANIFTSHLNTPDQLNTPEPVIEGDDVDV